MKAKKIIRFYGVLRLGRYGLEMIHPEYQEVDNSKLSAEKYLTSVYRSTKGLSQNQLRKFINTAIGFYSDIKEEIDLKLPRKKIIYIDIENIDSYKLPETDDKIKVTLNGNYEEFKSLIKTKKYKELLEKGVKVVFKHKKPKENESVNENESGSERLS